MPAPAPRFAPPRTSGTLTRSKLGRASLAGAAAAALLTFGERGDAHPPYWEYGGEPYSVSVEDAQGNPLRTFQQGGTTFVLGSEGQRYEIRIENNTDRRVEAVLSVDGRDAVSGAVADYAHGRGYIVPAHGSIVVDGFRQSLERTAAFRFSTPGESYSARMGTPENVGVIGAAFFSERPPVSVTRPRPISPWEGVPSSERAERRAAPAPAPATKPQGASGSSAPSASAAARKAAPAPMDSRRRSESYGDDAGRRDAAGPSRIGTEYGESTWSPATEVVFRRKNPSHPDFVATLRYDNAQGLTARGINLYPYQPWPAARTTPEAFPGNRFAPPPP